MLLEINSQNPKNIFEIKKIEMLFENDCFILSIFSALQAFEESRIYLLWPIHSLLEIYSEIIRLNFNAKFY